MLSFNEGITFGFDRYIDINIYIYGLFILDEEKDILFNMKLNMSIFNKHKDKLFGIFKEQIEKELKKHIINKIKEKCTNVIELSIKHDVPVKNILHTIFINNKLDNIEIEWSSSSLKEFLYVPINHYLDYPEDILYLKTKTFKFKKYF